MTATNHALTGTLIAALLPAPIALPLAFVSHFVLDSLPHFGQPGVNDTRNKLFWTMLLIDMVLLLALYCLLFLYSPTPLVSIAAAFLATSPDLAWGWRLLREYLKKPQSSLNILSRFHSWIQWGERRWGWIIELTYFILMSFIVVRFI